MNEKELREAYKKQLTPPLPDTHPSVSYLPDTHLDKQEKKYGEKCPYRDPDFPKDYPQEKQDWDGKLEVNQTPQWIYEFNKFLVEERSTGEIIEFIRKEKELSKEEGRREGYRYTDERLFEAMEQSRLAVIAEVMDIIRDEHNMSKLGKSSAHYGWIDPNKIMERLDSLKTNSKL